MVLDASQRYRWFTLEETHYQHHSDDLFLLRQDSVKVSSAIAWDMNSPRLDDEDSSPMRLAIHTGCQLAW